MWVLKGGPLVLLVRPPTSIRCEANFPARLTPSRGNETQGHTAVFSPLLFVCYDDIIDVLTLSVFAGLSGGQWLAVGRDHNASRNGRLAPYLPLGFKRSPVDPLDGRGRVRRRSTCDRIVLAVKLSDVFGVD